MEVSPSLKALQTSDYSNNTVGTNLLALNFPSLSFLLGVSVSFCKCLTQFPFHDGGKLDMLVLRWLGGKFFKRWDAQPLTQCCLTPAA